MSTSETDFWARIDSEQARADESEQPTPPPDGSSASESAPHASTPATDLASAADRDSPTSAPTPAVVRPAAEHGSEKSKSQRVREFLTQHPEARNRDVVEALSSYGITANDVSNVKTQMRKKAEKQKSAKARGQGASAPRATPAHTTGERAPASAPAAAKSAATAPAVSEVAMGEIEAGLSFIESAGGIERARQIIDLIARIREVNIG